MDLQTQPTASHNWKPYREEGCPPLAEPGDITQDANGRAVYSKALTERVKIYLDGIVEYGSDSRQWAFKTMRMSDYYRVSRQWLKGLRRGKSNVLRYEDLTFRKDDPAAVPMPCMNVIEGQLRNEASRLSRPDYSPTVPVSGVNPDIDSREGAVLAVQALEYTLEENNWPWQLCLGTNHMPQYGGWWLKTWFEYSYDKATRTGVTTAMHCESGCGFTLAKPQISVEQATRLGGAAAGLQLSGSAKEVNVMSCPVCALSVPPAVPDEMEAGEGMEGGGFLPGQEEIGEAPKMVPFDVSAQERTMMDSVGRPLGKDMPTGRGRCETRFEYDIWLKNDGQGVLPGQYQELCEVFPVDLDWLRNRYDLAFDVEPENEEALQKYHPFGTGLSGTAETKKSRRVRLWEFYKQPWRVKDQDTGEMTTNRGLMIHYSHGKILYYGDLMEKDATSGELYPKVSYNYAANEIRDGGRSHRGVSMFEGLWRSQDTVNLIFSMLEDTLTRMGMPSWLVPLGMSFAWKTGGRAGRNIRFDPDERFPDYPKPVGNVTLDPSVYQHLEQILKYMEDHSMARDVEKGGVPPGVTAAQAIQLTSEQAGQQRAQRIIRINNMLSNAYSHLLMLLANKVSDPRPLWKKDNPGQYQQRIWSGEDLHGQTRVKVNASPNQDSDVLQFANLQQVITLGTLDPKNPKVARIINRRAHVPDEILAQDNLQADMAEREFMEFLKADKAPWVDSQLDNDAEHYDKHGEDLESETWRDIQEKAGMAKVWPYLEAWNEKVPPSPEMLAQIPPPPPPTPGAPPMPPPGPPPSFSPFEAMAQQMQFAQQLPALQDQIMAFWGMVLQQRLGMPPLTPQANPDLWKALYARAHMAAHKMRMEKLAAQSSAGIPTAAAPESVETMSGMQPGTGANSGPIDQSSVPVAAPA